MAMALISLTWETQKQRGVQLFLQWAIMQGVAMLLQNRYQRQRLCTHIALGKARRMDVVWGETAGVDGQLWLLAPILFILQPQAAQNRGYVSRSLKLSHTPPPPPPPSSFSSSSLFLSLSLGHRLISTDAFTSLSL
ncbi:uncharacterized protein LOC114322461 isoform X4 [Camellia sinensis]|uniref:uncharacterized protein LOC114322461 isoform X4 n=1 Tax=Camellia sinensis TaxID=4442 RepID=UPI0010363D96|nr:uncharacterized protein LOC114322461 isoform X4 [Camellia sinensis]